MIKMKIKDVNNRDYCIEDLEKFVDHIKSTITLVQQFMKKMVIIFLWMTLLESHYLNF